MMNIHYIGHACIRIDTGTCSILTDPWLHGPAYCGQWYIFPKPVDDGAAERSDVILISHGHEDHLHEPTLRQMRKDAHIYYPYSWYGGIRSYLHGLGFKHVTEATTSRTYALNDDTSVTYIANNLDSIIVIEHAGQVIVNANDALHAYHPNVIDAFVRLIRERWPRIDTLFCGFGGASYFPNMIHVPGKDDREIARVREQLFVHNFCRIVHGLSPSVAVPFAADFVLLGQSQRWINTTRFQREEIAGYFRAYFGETPQGTTIHAMYPGDVLSNGALLPNSPYRNQRINGNLDHLIDEQYKLEIERTRTTFHIPEAQAEKLRHEIHENIERRTSLFNKELLARLRFSVQVSDVAERNCYSVSFDAGEPHVRRINEPADDELLLIRTTSEILRYSFGSDWGGDAITIGYGADIVIRNESTVEAGLDVACVRLLTRHPTTTRHMLHAPLRAARFLLNNPLTRKWAVKQIRNPGQAIQESAGRKEWLRRTKCEVCRICDLPLLDTGLSNTIR